MPASPATYVYVSNAEDGDISTYRLLDSGALEPGPRCKVGGVVMPMAVSPDKRFLYAAGRGKPFTVHVFAIDPASGSLSPTATAPLAESFPYICL
ncbi:MAG TPA: beta-propeller fold lactonase family protein, partial [Usitatibacter sp.]|nr:beta-propeller fold lactonase family protein [Usitatibacter sp.]